MQDPPPTHWHNHRPAATRSYGRTPSATGAMAGVHTCVRVWNDILKACGGVDSFVGRAGCAPPPLPVDPSARPPAPSYPYPRPRPLLGQARAPADVLAQHAHERNGQERHDEQHEQRGVEHGHPVHLGADGQEGVLRGVCAQQARGAAAAGRTTRYSGGEGVSTGGQLRPRTALYRSMRSSKGRSEDTHLTE